MDDREALKEHYQSEWHLHNLKRKVPGFSCSAASREQVAGLPMLTQEQFARRQAQDKLKLPPGP